MHKPSKDLLTEKNLELEKELVLKNLELEIEAALERVRSRTMAMQRSDELREVVAVLYEQMVPLGFAALGCELILCDKQNEVLQHWSSSPEQAQQPECYPIPKAIHPFFQRMWQAWEKGTPHLVVTLKGMDKRKFDELIFEKTAFKNFPESAKKAIQAGKINVFSFVTMKYGLLESVDVKPLAKDKFLIIERFANVFEQTYTRFLDLQKAEAQAKEAQIETALEKVRSRSLAMHKSDELQEVITTVLQRINELGLSMDSAFVGLPLNEKNSWIMWIATNDYKYSHGFKIPFGLNTPISIDLEKVYHSENVYFAKKYSKEEKDAFYAELFEHTDFKGISQARKDFLLSCNDYGVSIAKNKISMIGAISYTGKILSEQEAIVLKRFSHVFEQAYTRFLDLQKAEAQTREAQIENALEKVRSRSLAMHKGEELDDVLTIVYEKLTELKVDFDVVTILIFSEKSKDAEHWTLTNTQVNYSKVKVPYVDKSVSKDLSKARADKLELFTKNYCGDAKEEILHYMFTQSDYKKIPEERKKFLVEREEFTFSVGIGKRIGIQLNSFYRKAFSDEENEILMRFTTVLEQAYVRFLDLQKAEAQTREAQIEAALERVRSRSLAMHKSDELQEVITTVLERLNELGLAMDSATICLSSQENKELVIWIASKISSKDYMYSEGFSIPFGLKSVIIKDIENAQSTENASFTNKYSKEEKDAFYMELFECSDFRHLSQARKDFLLSADQYGLSAAVSKNSGIYTLSYSGKILKQEEIEVLQRFSRVFEQAYTRFLDLQKAEAQAKEAQIEAGLERVRSASLAMHESKDLHKIVNVVLMEMEGLDMSLSSVLIHEYGIETKDMFFWAAAGGMDYPEIVCLPFIKTSYYTRFNQAREKSEAFFTDVIPKKEKDLNWRHYFKYNQVAEERQQYLLSTPGLSRSAALFKNTAISINRYDKIPFSEDANKILIRFGQVFQQSYQRFLDLQKAEAQTREAQIEAALERIRSRSLAMHNSEELVEVATVLYKELRNLDIREFSDVSIVIVDEKNNQQIVWGARTESDYIEKSLLPLLGDPVLQRLYNKWRQKEAFFTLMIEGVELRNHLNFVFPKGNRTEIEDLAIKGMPDPTFFHCAFFPMGYLELVADKELSDDSSSVLARFAKVFEQTYTRFLDIQKAEAQAREAQIEAALERVRSRSMAMHHSQELLSVISVVSEQLLELGLRFDVASFAINNHEQGYNFWLSATALPEPAHIEVPYLENAMFERVKEALENKQTFYADIVTPEDNREWVQHMLDHTNLGLSEEIKNYILNNGYARSIALMPHIQLIVSNYASVAYNEDENKIVMRFAAVFEQAYTRFLDLQKAEAQVREAQIEAALERIRARALAMRSSSDLIEVANVLREQMGQLNQPELESSIVHLYNDGSRTFEAWYAYRPHDNPDAEIITGTGFISTDSSQWSKETMTKYQSSDNEYTIVSKGKKLAEWYNALSTVAPDTLAYDDKGKMIIPKILYYHYSNFSGGSLLMISNQKPSDEAKELQRRAAKVFNLAYQRFLDLQQAEARAKETIKQASLDRVRGEIASMRFKDDLTRITPLVWSELQELGVPFFRCGVMIVDEKEEKVQFYLSTPDGKPLAAMHLDFEGVEIASKGVDHWRRNKVYIETWNKEQFILSMKNLMAQGQIQNAVSYQGGEEPPESLTLQFVPFPQGMLYVGSAEPLNSAQIELVKELSKAFSVAYSRYEDFTKLEDAKTQVEHTLKDLQATQTQLIQAEKMASLGELTAGIAHEIQNPLNFVNNFSEVSGELLDEMNEEIEAGDIDEVKIIVGDIKQNLEKINHHGKRASDIVKGMLQHSRTSTGQKEPTDINALADEYLRLAYHGLRAKDKSFNSDFKTEFDETIPKVNVIPQDIGRVLLNLINNAFFAVNQKAARHSDPEHSEGVESGVAASHDGYQPEVVVSTEKLDGHIEISVKDNGEGIPEQVRDKIFQPFFTTKPTGSGTGLGLSLSYDIVTAHGGTLEVESSEGKGSEFVIILPVA